MVLKIKLSKAGFPVVVTWLFILLAFWHSYVYLWLGSVNGFFCILIFFIILDFLLFVDINGYAEMEHCMFVGNAMLATMMLTVLHLYTITRNGISVIFLYVSLPPYGISYLRYRKRRKALQSPEDEEPEDVPLVNKAPGELQDAPQSAPQPPTVHPQPNPTSVTTPSQHWCGTVLATEAATIAPPFVGYCPRCNAHARPEDVFCSRCGCNLGIAGAEKQYQQAKEAYLPPGDVSSDAAAIPPRRPRSRRVNRPQP